MHPMVQIAGLALAVVFCVKSVHDFSIICSSRILDHEVHATKQTLVQITSAVALSSIFARISSQFHLSPHFPRFTEFASAVDPR